MAERSYEHARLSVKLSQHTAKGYGLFGSELFHLEIQTRAFERGQHLAKNWNLQPGLAKSESSFFVLETITRVQTAELVERRIGDAALTIGRPVDRFVVHDHDVIIGRHAEIHLEHVDPEIARMLESVERVLWPQTPAASMSDDPRAWRVEESVLAYAVVRVDDGEIEVQNCQ